MVQRPKETSAEMDATNIRSLNLTDDKESFAFGDVLPSQYYDIVGGRRSGDGARDLMFAVLEDAIRCYLTERHAKSLPQRRLFEEAKDWIEARGDIAPFSFESICETFDIDADALRRQLKAAAPLRIPRRMRPVKRRAV
jgi:hypothetical protein